MAVTQTGTTLLIGNQRSITNYIIVQDGIGAANVVMEDIEDQDGTLETRIVFRNEAQIKLELISKTGATPATDFPIGAKCAVTGLTGYWVDSCDITRTKSAEKTSVTLTLIGI